LNYTPALSRGFLRIALLTCNGGQPSIQKNYSGNVSGILVRPGIRRGGSPVELYSGIISGLSSDRSLDLQWGEALYSKKYSGNVSGILMRPGIASRGKPCRTRAERLLKQKSCGNSRGFLRIALLTCNGGQPSIQKNTVAISRGFLRTALLTCNGGQPPIQKQYSGMSRSFLQIALS